MSAEINAVMDALGKDVGTTLIAVLVAMLILCVLLLIYTVIVYVFNGLGLYAIAKRRGILHPWLAWVPFGNVWILGDIADQYQSVTKGKLSRRRVVLLIACIVYGIVYITINFAFDHLPLGANMTETTAALGVFLETMLGSLIILAFGIAYSVIYYIALYDLYRSCNPKRAVTYLLLSVFLGVTQPFLVFSCRKQDLGMVPEKKPEEPMWQISQQSVSTDNNIKE